MSFPGFETHRRTPLRVKRRRTRLILFLSLLMIACMLAGLASYVSYRPRFSIQAISVSGASGVSPDAIRTYAESVLTDHKFHFLSRRNIFLYRADAIEQGIVATFPPVKEAHMGQPSLLSTTMHVEITERQPFAMWCGSAGHCYQMDNGGFVFAEAQHEASSTEYIFGGGLSGDPQTSPIGQTFAPTHVQGLVALLNALGQAGYGPKGATVENSFDFTVPFSQGYFIKASFGASPSDIVHDLQLVLSSGPLQGKQDQVEYIDLRFGNRVYYKLKGETIATSTHQ